MAPAELLNYKVVVRTIHTGKQIKKCASCIYESHEKAEQVQYLWHKVYLFAAVLTEPFRFKNILLG